MNYNLVFWDNKRKEALRAYRKEAGVFVFEDGRELNKDYVSYHLDFVRKEGLQKYKTMTTPNGFKIRVQNHA